MCFPSSDFHIFINTFWHGITHKTTARQFPTVPEFWSFKTMSKMVCCEYSVGWRIPCSMYIDISDTVCIFITVTQLNNIRTQIFDINKSISIFYNHTIGLCYQGICVHIHLNTSCNLCIFIFVTTQQYLHATFDINNSKFKFLTTIQKDYSIKTIKQNSTNKTRFLWKTAQICNRREMFF